MPLWNIRRFQLVIPFEMLPFYSTSIYYGAYLIHSLEADVSHDIRVNGSGEAIVPEEYAKQVVPIIETLSDVCGHLDLKRVLERLERLSAKLPNLVKFYYLSDLLHELRELDLAMMTDLKESRFFYMPLDRVGYYEQEELFGADVKANFRSTIGDVKEAGSCYATGRNTACVFHCMRVLEKGLHAMVHDLNNKFNANLTFTKEIDATNWGEILTKIENLFTQQRLLQQLNPQPTSQDKQFYSVALKEFQYFKDAWRNDVSHSRSSYDEHEAKAVMAHVGAFMKQIATSVL